MSPDFDPWSLLNKAWVLIAGAFVWIFKRHIGEDDEREKNWRAAVDRLNDKIDTNHRQVMDALLSRRD